MTTLEQLNVALNFVKDCLDHEDSLTRAEAQSTIELVGEVPSREGQCSDGYHTFDELYDHRIELFLALCRVIASEGPIQNAHIWKSRLHSDGNSFEGWFIVGIGKKKGDQITYHLPNDLWDRAEFVTLERAPEFDGHTSDDVLSRLRAIE